MSNQDIEKFSFSLDFEEEEERRKRLREERRRQKAEQAKKKYTDEDLVEARKTAAEQARQEARQEAEKEFEQAVEHRQNAALEVIGDRLKTMMEELHDQRIGHQRRAVTTGIQAAIALFKQIAPDIAADNADARIEEMVYDVLQEQIERPRMTIYLAPGMADALSDKIKARANEAGYDGQLQINSADDLAMGDVRIDWGDGGIERDEADYHDELVAILQSALARMDLPVPPAPKKSEEDIGKPQETAIAKTPEEIIDDETPSNNPDTTKDDGQ